ncbi:nucleoside deoxyribosyltransferase [Gordonia phage Goib]|uniref:Nucleoside deoxyribosyltransferase n=2 Tax=Vendettavirus vendetta TaxID=2049886 RepID=A0A166Y4A7_9CAUD|nr:nucleoside deoxyribosyltransferase [Gordonia phage Vendetta]YP_009275424.1 nucleoside deoxyribosyltransferase [Gordonia phage Splinter]ANA85617.1 nucleoside deoxyribosyltransferase [Gordonia phage Vendetta]ANA85696.1 nucleoside deoxyribosyltransferase [Gordonia phage Splinter]WNO25812.1 nucleoside deoxyribosyltransferase [Gordonia phage Goib]
MKLVVIESPFAGDQERNVRYGRAAMLDSLRRGEAPYASHLIYPQVLDDTNRAERIQGMAAGFAWGVQADLVAVYCDLGVSEGMRHGIEEAEKRGTPVEYRDLKEAGPW